MAFIFNKLMNKKFIGILIFLLSIFCMGLYSQRHSTKSLMEYLNKIYGNNAILNNGPIYYNLEPKAKGNQFLTTNYIKGNLYINNSLFNNLNLKYNIHQDNLMIKVDIDSNITQQVTLSSAYIDSFNLSSLQFIHSRYMNFNDSVSPGYYAKLFSGKVQLLKRVYKEFINVHNEIYPYGYYTDIKTKYYILFNNELHHIDKKKDLYHIFRSDKIVIKKYIKKNKIKFRKLTDVELIGTIKYCNEFLD